MSKSGREYFRLGAESYSSLGRVGKKRRKYSRPLLDVFESSPVSVKVCSQLSKIKDINLPNFSRVLEMKIIYTNEKLSAGKI